MDVIKKHFVLVHGGCHGAWSWYQLTTLLRSVGHRVTALDLSASGINPKQPLDLRSISDYSKPLIKFMDSLPTTAAAGEKVILVAHGFGGVSVSQVMESYPEKISVAVFVAAFMGGPEHNVLTLLLEYLKTLPASDNVYTYEEGPCKAPTTFIFGPNFLASNLYQLSPPEDLTLAKMLVRPMPLFNDNKSLKEVALTHERYGSVSRVYIVTEENKALVTDFQYLMIEKNPTDEVKEIKGSDQMVMLSKPRELFSCLQEIAANYN